MNNQGMQFGSGSALLGQGASQALNEAIARRNQGQAGTTAQVTPNAATSVNQVPSPTPLTGSPAPTPTAMAATPQAGIGGSAGLPVENSEAQLILKALSGRLKMLPV
jgi:hypothetical protein